jgi:predicted component of type VI protein secretion system
VPGSEPTVQVSQLDEHGAESTLPEGRTLVGRAPENDVAVDVTHRSVSRKHLIIDKAAGSVYLTDLSSLGTFIDAAAVAPG